MYPGHECCDVERDSRFPGSELYPAVWSLSGHGLVIADPV